MTDYHSVESPVFYIDSYESIVVVFVVVIVCVSLVCPILSVLFAKNCPQYFVFVQCIRIVSGQVNGLRSSHMECIKLRDNLLYFGCIPNVTLSGLPIEFVQSTPFIYTSFPLALLNVTDCEVSLATMFAAIHN